MIDSFKYDIVLASYNGDAFLKEQIDSIIDAVEYCEIGSLGSLIISDDSSNDSTLCLLEELKLKYPFIKIYNNSNPKGVINNFQNGLNYSNSDFVFFSDQDDIWFVDKISTSLNEIHAISCTNENIPILVFSKVCFVDANLNKISFNLDFSNKTSFINGSTCFRSFGQGCTMVLNRRLIDLACPLPIESIMHDWWFLIVASNFGIVRFIDKELMYYRQHGNNVAGGYKNFSFFRFVNIRKQIKYIKSVSIQSQIFIKRYDSLCDKSSRSFQFHMFLANLANKNFLERLYFVFKYYNVLEGAKNRLKFMIQIIFA